MNLPYRSILFWREIPVLKVFHILSKASEQITKRKIDLVNKPILGRWRGFYSYVYTVSFSLSIMTVVLKDLSHISPILEHSLLHAEDVTKDMLFQYRLVEV